ncbi:type I-G CRISPR-associated helicase/endonuclease Cas3g [Iamia sp.]|uniref:type I-G CRISPR-associated helicase/endonuclease Cas3g n=1 Tax=Iamia sp. TaxID=2722710 RepID=UPI002B7C03DA|nr:helicase-related protein [Iamia sp.]HXH58592.1 helicase-related protein [Iamia sp.]
MTTTSFDELFSRATGHPAPYRWQQQLADEGLPETVEIPTGCGKTLAVVLAWVYRRRHASPAVRHATPRKLVFSLPMRTLVEQTRDVIRGCLSKLGLSDEVILATLMGGEPTSDEWRLHPEQDAIVVCTLDMGLSGALNRAYGSSRFTWPVTFGLLNNDAHWILDEVQLMGPGAVTSRQLQAFRTSMGTALPTASTWMSATLHADRLATVDAPTVASPLRLSPGDEPPALLRRLNAPRRFERWVPERDEKIDKKELARLRAAAIVSHHRPGTRTLIVVNTVETARTLHTAVIKAGVTDAHLIHSRFRPDDRRAALDRALAVPGPDGSIVVSTQVVEAGVDLSSANLFTEVAPWSSIVQRAGRCNRAGEVRLDAPADQIPCVYWDPSLSALPYDETAIETATHALDQLTGTTITTKELADVGADEPAPEHFQVLRRADLIRLFDTAPDLGGDDLDIVPYLRDGEDLDARVCWRELDDKDQPVDSSTPKREELCPVPVGELRTWLKKRRRLIRLDYLDGDLQAGRRRQHQWVRASADAVRPGHIYIADRSEGGYASDRGWDLAITSTVESVTHGKEPQLAPVDETLGSDPASVDYQQWITLDRHLTDVGSDVQELITSLGSMDLSEDLTASAVAAGRWHDLGKAHDVFQATLARTAASGAEPDGPGPWAKSGGNGKAHHSRRAFRHELASALALLGDAGIVLADDVDRDLTVYLVAAHHGRVRMSIRSFPGEEPSVAGGRAALGVHDGDLLRGGEYGGVVVPDCTMDLEVMELGATKGSWVEMSTSLRDRPDLGVFRLAHLEALVRVADWRVSASYRDTP